ncbi:hypothetical protein H4R35_007306 [Dimargaris xerosporica]|nr:hypothetical protein H4R35_007306 [Dimargaris xerosporica]
MDSKRKLTALVADYSSDDDSANEATYTTHQPASRINALVTTHQAAVERPKRPKFTHAQLRTHGPSISASVAHAALPEARPAAKAALPADFFDNPRARPSGNAVAVTTDPADHSAPRKPSTVPRNSQQPPSLESRAAAHVTSLQPPSQDLVAEQRRIQEAEEQYANQVREEQTTWFERRTWEESDKSYYRERIQALKQIRHRHTPQASLAALAVNAPGNELALQPILDSSSQLASFATTLRPADSLTNDSDGTDGDDFAEFLDWRQQSL